jgi:hypothetical protein
MPAVEQVIAVACEFPVTSLEVRESGFDCTLTVALPSGVCIPFDLEICPGASEHLSVREQLPGQLPRCCPDRHITPRSWFCLNWIAGDPHPVVDAASARSWWALLWDFLTRQITAGRIGRWSGPMRAHGEAVIYQDRAERCAAELGARLLAEVSEGDFRTRSDQRRGRNRIELLKNDVVVNRIHAHDRTLTNHEMSCPCPRGNASKVPIKHCEGHAVTFAALIDALHRWTRAEREYFSRLREARITCCKTLHRCGLR